MAILLQVGSCKKQLFRAGQLIRCRNFLCGSRNRLLIPDRCVLQQNRFAFAELHCIVRCIFEADGCTDAFGRSQFQRPAEYFFAAFQYTQGRSRQSLRRIHGHTNGTVVLFYANGRLRRCVFQCPGFFIGHKVLNKRFFFIRLQKGKIRLIVCKYACHQLNIRTIRIRQISVPRFAKVTAAPCPLLFTGRNMMVGNM